MARYILIDRASGCIFADSARLSGFDHSAGTPAEAAQALDAELKNAPADYASVPRRSDAATYDVFRADARGSDAVPAIHDGQSQEMIEAVERDCDYVCSLARLYTVERAWRQMRDQGSDDDREWIDAGSIQIEAND